MRVDSPFLTTISEPLLALRLFVCCVSSVKKYPLGTSRCHDHDIFTLHQPIRLQHFEGGNENPKFIYLKSSNDADDDPLILMWISAVSKMLLI